LPLPTIPGSAVEIAEEPVRQRIRHAVFDLDGTISLMRDGWQDHMVPLMIETLESCPRHESREELQAMIIDFVDHLTGKQTIYQMIRLAEEVEKRGGTPLEPLEYKALYNERLVAGVGERMSGLVNGSIDPSSLLVAGSKELLEDLNSRGVRCYLASGTDTEYVKKDADLLGIEHLLEGGIFGALPNYKDFSKAKVIARILSDFDLKGPELLIVGDGYIEIENAREAQAIAFGVHSCENNRYHMNADKRGRLLKAGAHFLAEDLSEGRAVLDYLEP
jgi:phosphoglycolate phosphatase-like HAD superfamily hydrolase